MAFSGVAGTSILALSRPAAGSTSVAVARSGAVAPGLVVVSAAPTFARARVFATSVAALRESRSFALRRSIVVASASAWGSATTMFCVQLVRDVGR